jgi:hypothetical protein
VVLHPLSSSQWQSGFRIKLQECFPEGHYFIPGALQRDAAVAKTGYNAGVFTHIPLAVLMNNQDPAKWPSQFKNFLESMYLYDDDYDGNDSVGDDFAEYDDMGLIKQPESPTYSPTTPPRSPRYDPTGMEDATYLDYYTNPGYFTKEKSLTLRDGIPWYVTAYPEDTSQWPEYFKAVVQHLPDQSVKGNNDPDKWPVGVRNTVKNAMNQVKNEIDRVPGLPLAVSMYPQNPGEWPDDFRKKYPELPDEVLKHRFGVAQFWPETFLEYLYSRHMDTTRPQSPSYIPTSPTYDSSRSPFPAASSLPYGFPKTTQSTAATTYNGITISRFFNAPSMYSA